MATTIVDRKLTLVELADAWGWSPSKLYRLVEAQAIPHARIRGRIYFEPGLVEAWFACYRRAERQREDAIATPAERSRLDERRALGLSDEETFGM